MSNRILIIRNILPAVALAAVLALVGCATQPYGNGYGYDNTGTRYGTAYGTSGVRGGTTSCSNCGVVQSVQQVYVNGSGNGNDSHVLGTVIGALVGGALGNQVGKGDGRKAATVAGVVAGGVAGNAIAKRNNNGSGTDVGYQVTVRLDDGRMATVTQRENPGVRSGDYVQISNNQVYLR
jgi:outer membrane lipoprotein SlyB